MHADSGDAYSGEGLTYVGRESAIARDSAETVRTAVLDFFQAEYEGIIAFLLMYGAIYQDAEDATQDAFVDAWSLAKRRPEAWTSISSPRAWIRVVALRKYHRPTGQRKLMSGPLVAEISDDQWHETAPSHDELTVQTEFVRSVLRSMAPDIKAVMALHFDGFTSVEIGCYLEMTDQHVRDLIKKGRKILRASLVALGVRDWRQGCAST
jgi:RNA polymerase sigma-70 factor (ECF subfamily)